MSAIDGFEIEEVAAKCGINPHGFGGLTICGLVFHEFNYLLRYVTEGRFDDLRDFDIIKENKEAILNNVTCELNRDEPQETIVFGIPVASAKDNLTNLAKIVEAIAEYASIDKKIREEFENRATGKLYVVGRTLIYPFWVIKSTAQSFSRIGEYLPPHKTYARTWATILFAMCLVGLLLGGAHRVVIASFIVKIGTLIGAAVTAGGVILGIGEIRDLNKAAPSPVFTAFLKAARAATVGAVIFGVITMMDLYFYWGEANRGHESEEQMTSLKEEILSQKVELSKIKAIADTTRSRTVEKEAEEKNTMAKVMARLEMIDNKLADLQIPTQQPTVEPPRQRRKSTQQH